MPELKANFKSVQSNLGGSLPGRLIFGIPGKDGGYYLVAAEQVDANTIRFIFTPSQEEMPKVDPVEVDLPGATDEQIRKIIEEYLQNNPAIGQPGKDGFSPIAKVTQTDDGVVITITDKNGTTEAVVKNGKDGGAVTDEQIAEAVEEYFSENPVKGVSSVVANVTDHGISTEAEDNTPALQALIDNLSSNGGGIIFFPVGIYNFANSISAKSHVSIIGENIDSTILRQNAEYAYPLFGYAGTADNPIRGCLYSNFTVDAYSTGNKHSVRGKAFFYQYVKDCVFRDLVLKGTIATAMGIDFLDRVIINNVSCIDCGRLFTGSQQGTSGIGIGTGGWENENFIISDCVCVGSGKFGIFVENQYQLGWGGNVQNSKGCIISNCVVRNGLNHGIGVRGGENITIIGCETYENANHGIYIDNKCKNVRIMSCSATANGGHGMCVDPDADSARITIKGCVSVDNALTGVLVSNASDKLCITDTYTDGNLVGLKVENMTLRDCVLHGNTFLDGIASSAVFAGNIDYNEAINKTPPTAISVNAMTVAKNVSARISYAVTPGSASNVVTFESTNTGIATVSDTGFVTGVNTGTCQIIVRSVWDTSVTATCDVTVVDTETALYPFINGSNAPVTISNGNTVSISGATSAARKYNLSDCSKGTAVAGTDVLFSLNAGDTVVINVDGISITGDNNVLIALNDTKGTSVIKSDNITADQTSSTTTIQVSSDVVIHCVIIFLNQSVTEFEGVVSITVNGAKYV